MIDLRENTIRCAQYARTSHVGQEEKSLLDGNFCTGGVFVIVLWLFVQWVRCGVVWCVVCVSVYAQYERKSLVKQKRKACLIPFYQNKHGRFHVDQS